VQSANNKSSPRRSFLKANMKGQSVMRSSKLLAATAMAVASLLALAEPGAAGPRHGGGAHVNRNMNHNVNRNRNVNRNVNRNTNVNRNVNRNANVNVNRNVNRNVNVGYHGGVYHGGWAGRPYRWAPGGAIAAGAAIGVIAAGTAVAWAPPPPQPGLCWYYTDQTQRNGFWDTCP
jgi:hypothetical protein